MPPSELIVSEGFCPRCDRRFFAPTTPDLFELIEKHIKANHPDYEIWAEDE